MRYHFESKILICIYESELTLYWYINKHQVCIVSITIWREMRPTHSIKETQYLLFGSPLRKRRSQSFANLYVTGFAGVGKGRGRWCCVLKFQKWEGLCGNVSVKEANADSFSVEIVIYKNNVNNITIIYILCILWLTSEIYYKMTTHIYTLLRWFSSCVLSMFIMIFIFVYCE